MAVVSMEFPEHWVCLRLKASLLNDSNYVLQVKHGRLNTIHPCKSQIPTFERARLFYKSVSSSKDSLSLDVSLQSSQIVSEHLMLSSEQ